jgi:hypothetical protein
MDVTLIVVGGLVLLGLLFLLAFRKAPSVPPPPPPVPTPPPPTPPPNGQHLTLVVQTTAVATADVNSYLVAQNKQLQNEFYVAWRIAAYIDRIPGGWPVYLMDNSDVPGALGYHDVDANNVPFAKVFIQTSRVDGLAWQSVGSHEVMEMVADPGPAFKTLPDDQGNQWDVEVGDPVEDVSYPVNGITMSAFVFPEWWISGSTGPWDDQGVLTHDHGLTPGGYAVENGQQVLGPARKARGNSGRGIDRVYKRGRV